MQASNTNLTPIARFTTGVSHVSHEAISSVWSFAKILGSRGSDGFPYVIKIAVAAGKIFKGMGSTHPAGLTVTVLAGVLKQAVDPISCLTSPFVDLEDTVDSVQSAIRALNGEVERKKKCKFEYKTPDGRLLPKELAKAHPSQSEYTVIDTSDKVKKTQAVVEAFASLSIYFSGICEAAVMLANVGAVTLGDSTLARLAQVGGVCFTVFSFIGATGLLVKCVIAGAKYYNAPEGTSSEKIEILKATFKLAAVNLLKTAVKVTLMVFTLHFSLAFQGVMALGLVSLDIYITGLKRLTVETETRTIVLMDPRSHSEDSLANQGSVDPRSLSGAGSALISAVHSPAGIGNETPSATLNGGPSGVPSEVLLSNR